MIIRTTATHDGIVFTITADVTFNDGFRIDDVRLSADCWAEDLPATLRSACLSEYQRSMADLQAFAMDSQTSAMFEESRYSRKS